jgi:hypothetical protein
MAVVAHEGWWRGHLVVDWFAKSEQLCSGAKKLRAGAQLDRCRGTRQWPRRGVCVGVTVLSSAADYPLGPQPDDHFQIKTTLSDSSLSTLLTPPDYPLRPQSVCAVSCLTAKSNGAGPGAGPKIRARFQKLALSTSFQVLLSGVTTPSPVQLSCSCSCLASLAPQCAARVHHNGRSRVCRMPSFDLRLE